MRSIKKNAVILTVMLFICAAVYLNWSYNKQVEDAANAGGQKETPTSDQTDDGALSADTLVNEGGAGLFYTVNGAPEGDGKDADQTGGELAEYFADVRLRRSQARDEAAATLSAVASAQGASQETVDGALKAMTELAQRAVQEAELESKIRAKGFVDCVVYLTDGRASVTVAMEGGLTAASVAQITDIIVSETGLGADRLTVTEKKI